MKDHDDVVMPNSMRWDTGEDGANFMWTFGYIKAGCKMLIFADDATDFA